MTRSVGQMNGRANKLMNPDDEQTHNAFNDAVGW